MARFTRIGGSFAIVLVAYCAYALVAVPLIDPRANQHGTGPLSREELQDWAEKSKQRWREEFKDLFPSDAWELKETTNVVEIDQVKLLLEGYTTEGGDKEVEIKPFTMILMPDDPDADADQRRRRAVVLEAPEGAVLEFTKPFELRRVQFGRLLGGRLNGPITIRSQGKSLGPEDDLRVDTHDVTMSEEEIKTESEVEFRLGSSYGSGQGLRIKLVPKPKEEGDEQAGPNVEGVEFIEIEQLDRVHLYLDDEGIVPDGAGRATGGQERKASAAASDVPIEITCRGPFRFDPIQQVATFKDQVDVVRVHREGPSDQLNNCDKLSIHFARPRDALAAPGDEESRPSDFKRQWELHPRRITAQGTSMAVHAPSQQFEAEGEFLDYDFETGWITLDGTQEVFLKRGEREIHAPWIKYQLVEEGHLGQAMAGGPGRIRARLGDEGEQQLSARWGRMLQLRPYQGQPVISLTGDAELDFAQLGKLTAPEIHFYLFELPPEKPDGQVRVRPDRMVALTYPVDAADQRVPDDERPARAVQLVSPQVTATVEQLRVWFEQLSPRADDNGRSGRDRKPDLARGRLPTGVAGPSERAQGSLLAAGGQQTGDRPDHHFTIKGQRLRALVLVPEDVSSKGGDPELAELTMEEDVELIETQSAEPDEPPVVVSGDLIHVRRADQPSRSIVVAGNPPRFEGRGLVLSGPEGADSSIELDAATNKLGIDKPGWMELPLDRDFEGRPLPRPGRLHIVWQKRMTFNGHTVRFEGAVVATGRYQKGEIDGRPQEGETEVHTEALDVTLVRTISFADLDREPDRPEIQRIFCYGQVFMENFSWDSSGPLSFDRMLVANLDVDMISGQSAASGPGWIVSVRHGSPDFLASGRENRPTAPSSAPSQEEDDQLQYLYVRFQGSIEGNVHNREMTLYDQVRAVNGPVDSWDAQLDPDNPEALGPKGVIVTCDRLSVAEMPQPLGGRAMELTAAGNVEAEGRTFTARAPLITYNHAKQLIILDGQGRLAELYHQDRVGAPRRQVLLEKFSYWLSTKEVVAGNVHWMSN